MLTISADKMVNLATYDASASHPANAGRDVDFILKRESRYLLCLPQLSVMIPPNITIGHETRGNRESSKSLTDDASFDASILTYHLFRLLICSSPCRIKVGD